MNNSSGNQDQLFGHRWSREEDIRLKDFMEGQFEGVVDWEEVSLLFNNKRTPTHCKNRSELTLWK